MPSASGGPDFRSFFLPVDSAASVTVAVLARNGRGDGPPTDPVTAIPFSRPSAVTGLTVTGQDAALAASWNPADAPGSTVDHYDYRLNGGPWSGAGAGPAATIPRLTNGQEYTVEVRACNAVAGFADEIDVDEVGPSLKYATAKVTKTTRSGGQGGGGFSGGGDDPWASSPQGGAPAGGGQQGGGWGGQQGGGNFGGGQPSNDPWATGGAAGSSEEPPF